MGNQLSGTIPSTSTAGIDSYIEELSGLTYEKSLGNARFLKTIKGRCVDGPVVIKILVKPPVKLSFHQYINDLKAEYEALKSVPNAFPYQWQIETEKAVYVVRQYLHSSLYDRISTRPFLTVIEKKFITFQLLKGLADIHSRQVYHGDIKTENILVTSWNWVYLTDFSSFKPTYLPEDNPADFSFFFDTSSRRSCYLSPERFYSPHTKYKVSSLLNTSHKNPDNALTFEMDIFALGCVIAELFVESSPPFLLSQLLAYKRGEYDPDSYLMLIECESIRELVRHMIQPNPKKRFSASEYLVQWQDKAFPSYFYTFLYPYLASLVDPTSDGPDKLYSSQMGLQTDSRIERFQLDFHRICALFGFGDHAQMEPEDEIELKDDLDELRDPRMTEDGAVLLISLLTSSVRNCQYPSTKIMTLDMMLTIGYHLTDDMKLDQIVPYLVCMLSDPSSIVKAHAIYILAELLDTVKEVSTINLGMFPEYLVPQLKRLTVDPEPVVRFAYARHIATLVEVAHRFFEIGKSHHPAQTTSATQPDEDVCQPLLDQVVSLLIDPESCVKRALLSSMPRLCLLFGLQKANDFLLSHMITYLNDRDWMLRCAFFESIVGVGTYVGGRSLEEYILPLMIQAITDHEEFVVEKVLTSLTSLALLKLFSKITLWDLLTIVAPLLAHPNLWIRYGAVGFTSVTASLLPNVDVMCVVNPLVNPYLKYPPLLDYDVVPLTKALGNPLSRSLFDEVTTWANSVPSMFDHLLRRSVDPSYRLPTTPANRPELELFNRIELQLKADQFDMQRLGAMRDYLIKVAITLESARRKPLVFTDRYHNRSTEGTIHLMSLGVTLRTEFFGAPEPHPPPSPKAISFSNARRGLSSDSIMRPNRSSYHFDKGINISPNLARGSPGSDGDISVHSRPNSLPGLNKGYFPAKGLVGDLSSASPHPPKALAYVSTTNTTIGSDPVQPPNGSAIVIDPKGFDPLASYLTKRPEGKGHLQVTSHDWPKRQFHLLLAKKGKEGFPTPPIGFGPSVPNQPPLPINPNRSYNRAWKPEGILVSHLAEHKAGINAIHTSPDHKFFASCSDDGSIKVWDCLKLDRHYSHYLANRSALTYYGLGGRVLDLCFIKNTYCLAGTNDLGDIHIFRVDLNLDPPSRSSDSKLVFPSYAKALPVKKFKIKGQYCTHIEHIVTEDRSWLVMVTNLGYICGLDLRTSELEWKLTNPLRYGMITSYVIDPTSTWMLVGTIKSILILYDLRYMIPIRSFVHPSQTPIRQIKYHGPHHVWLVAGDHNDVSLWDLNGLECRKVVMAHHPTFNLLSVISLKPLDVPTDEDLLSNSIAQLTLPNAMPPPPTSSPTLCLLPLHPTSLITGGTDRTLRYFDLDQSHNSTDLLPLQSHTYQTIEHDTVSVLFQNDIVKPNRSSSQSFRNSHIKGVQPDKPIKPKSVPIGQDRPVTLDPHLDAITAIQHVRYPSDYLVSGDRAGVIKVTI